MQKKKTLPDTSASSNWAATVQKQQMSQNAKKYIIWAGIIGVCVLALVGLVYYAGKSSSPITPTQPVQNLPKVTSNDIIVGDEKAPVTIVEYGDMQCPSCAAYNPLVNQVLSDYKGKVRLVYRFFPLQQHQNAIIAAQAAYAGWRLGKFDQMKDQLFENQSTWATLPDPRSNFVDYAKSIGLDSSKFETIMNSDEAKNYVLTAQKQGNDVGIMSTPTFILDGKSISPGSAKDFHTLIDAELASKK